MVEYARICFKVSRVRARMPPTAMEANPTTRSAVRRVSLFWTSGYTRPMRSTPAATIAAEWRYAETGVGAAIALGSQKWNGVCALFASPAMRMSAPAPVRSGPGSTTFASSGMEKVPWAA
jgi:hypothetical protein